MKNLVRLASLILIGSILLFLPCLAGASAAKNRNVILATTTSTQDTGLLNVLLPLFEKSSGYSVRTIAVGSGQAMKMGEKGGADVLLVHSPAAEKKFMADGFGSNRRLVMHNDFIIVGPLTDPAKIRSVTGITEAMRRIAASGETFISRGDNSGTHAKEKELWKAAGINPEAGKWHQQTGLGMGQTLTVASEKQGYTLTDRATYLAMKKNLGLAILCEGATALLNIYHVIEVNQLKWPKVNSAGGKAFADFMVSEKTQKIIGAFGVDKFGSPLFAPDAGRRPSDLEL